MGKQKADVPGSRSFTMDRMQTRHNYFIEVLQAVGFAQPAPPRV